MDSQERLDELVVKNQFDINAATDSIRFYWNLARQKGEPVVVEIWTSKPVAMELVGWNVSDAEIVIFVIDEEKTKPRHGVPHLKSLANYKAP